MAKFSGGTLDMAKEFDSVWYMSTDQVQPTVLNNMDHEDSQGGTYLCNSPWDEEGCVLGVWQHALCSVEEAEVCGTVDDDALHRHTEATVETDNAISLEDLGNTIAQTGELTLVRTFANISSQPVIQSALYVSVSNSTTIKDFSLLLPPLIIWPNCEWKDFTHAAGQCGAHSWPQAELPLHKLNSHVKVTILPNNNSDELTLFWQSRGDIQSRGMLLQQHHQKPGYPKSSARTVSFCRHRPRKLACTCPWRQSWGPVWGST